MTTHCKVYFKHFGYGIDDVIICEVCGKRAVDIHHLNGRGKGKDVISNLMALCRKCHDAAHGLTNTFLHRDMLQVIHNDLVARYDISNT